MSVLIQFLSLDERIGNLIVVVNDANLLKPTTEPFSAIEIKCMPLWRGFYLRPAFHGFRLINYVLTHPDLKAEW